MAENMTLEPCKECGSKDTSWSCAPRNNGQAVDGRICMREVGMQFYRGCSFCGETLEVIGADEFLTKINTHLAQPAQAVDVGAIRDVITWHLREWQNFVDRGTPWCGNEHKEQADKLTRAIGNAQAEGWTRVGTLTLQRWKGIDSMLNADFDYAGDLPDGDYQVFVQTPPQPEE